VNDRQNRAFHVVRVGTNDRSIFDVRAQCQTARFRERRTAIAHGFHNLCEIEGRRRRVRRLSTRCCQQRTCERFDTVCLQRDCLERATVLSWRSLRSERKIRFGGDDR
jgi:hypothetical protein